MDRKNFPGEPGTIIQANKKSEPIPIGKRFGICIWCCVCKVKSAGMQCKHPGTGWLYFYFVKVILLLCSSYIAATQQLYCCYAAVILYSPPKLGEAQYHLRSKYNWRSQYNSPKANITEKNGNRITITVLFWWRLRDSNL